MRRRAKASNEITVAVAGQPNSGKSTIFNCLTGARQYVANYPGVTVEKRVGICHYKGNKVVLVDLPGTYSLTSYSLEERVARDFLLHEKPDLTLDIVDASNLERNLYLTFQLLEMEIPMVIALNMMDVAQGRGFRIDPDELSRQLGAAVVPTVGNRGKGKRELHEAIWETYRNRESAHSAFRIDYKEALESVLAPLEKRLLDHPDLSASYPTRWLAVKLM
ncbi:MAG: 50S ribosome-binding GTPase, partial [Dehalococcoidia bacterium]|nr:50S ribosome-binding GTPase [Dehalococcoidia bacterium]